MWNEDLVVKVVAKAYQELLRQLLNEAKSGNIDAPTWYSFLPHLGTLTGRWLNLGEKVWQDIVKLDFISSEVCFILRNLVWLSLSYCIYCFITLRVSVLEFYIHSSKGKLMFEVH